MTNRQQLTTSDTGSAARSPAAHGPNTHDTVRLELAVGALGVVFGDIGTSPIYTLQTVFNPSDPHPVPVSTENVFGVVSLVFWSVMIIVTVTYVLLAMRADNDGEGGIMALITLLRRGAHRGPRAAVMLAALGIFGAALFFGDSMITPAISVLSAVEGLKVVEPSLEELVVPITAVIIVAASPRSPSVFLNRGKQTTPLAMRANVEHNHVRHEHVLIMSIETEPVPRVPAHERIVVDDLGYADDRITHVSARFGYMQTPDVPGTLRMLDPATTEGQLQLDQASYFLSKIELRRGDAPTMAPWRKRLFIATSYLTADAAEHFGLPRDRTVIMGSHIDV